jgi:hypothetical protein
MLTDF